MTTEARSLEQCVADARVILDGATAGPWEIEQYGGLWAGDDVLFPRPEYGQYRDGDADLITLSRNTYSSLLDLVEAAEEALGEAWGYASATCQEFCVHSTDAPESCPMNDPTLDRLDQAIRAVHESLQSNLPR